MWPPTERFRGAWLGPQAFAMLKIGWWSWKAIVSSSFIDGLNEGPRIHVHTWIVYIYIDIYNYIYIYMYVCNVCNVMYCIVFVLYCIVSYCILLYCIVLCCVVLYCVVLYCILLYCIVFYAYTFIYAHIYIYIYPTFFDDKVKILLRNIIYQRTSQYVSI